MTQGADRLGGRTSANSSGGGTMMSAGRVVMTSSKKTGSEVSLSSAKSGGGAMTLSTMSGDGAMTLSTVSGGGTMTSSSERGSGLDWVWEASLTLSFGLAWEAALSALCLGLAGETIFSVLCFGMAWDFIPPLSPVVLSVKLPVFVRLRLADIPKIILGEACSCAMKMSS